MKIIKNKARVNGVLCYRVSSSVPLVKTGNEFMIWSSWTRPFLKPASFLTSERVLFTPALNRVEPRKRSGLVSNQPALTAQRQPGIAIHWARVVKCGSQRYKLPDTARSEPSGVRATVLAPVEQWNTPKTGRLCLSPVEQLFRN